MSPFAYKIPTEVERVRETLFKDGGALIPSTPPQANLAAFMKARAEDPHTGPRVFLEALDECTAEATAEIPRRKFTFAEFDQASNRFANLLTGLGLSQGKAIGYIGDNIPEMHLTYIGTGKVGGLCAPLNPKDGLEKWLLTFKDCQVSAIVVQKPYFDAKFFELMKGLTTVKDVFVVTPEGEANLPEHPDLGCPMSTYAEAVAQQSTEFTAPEGVSWKDPFLLVYTSGTTGNPKGVVISLEIIWRCAQSLNEHFGFKETDTTFAQLSGFHVNHIVVSFWGALSGAYRCVMSNRFRAERYFQRLKDDQITISSVVPTNLAYAIKAELEHGQITTDPQFHQAFKGFLVEHLSKYVLSDKIVYAWKEALRVSGEVVDNVKFLDAMRLAIEPFSKSPKEFQETFTQAFTLGFAKSFQPFFKKRYGLDPRALRIICGAGDLSLDLAFNFSRLTGLHISQGWGMSEGTCYNSMSLANQSWLCYWLTLGSIGPEMSTTNMAIVATDQDMKPEIQSGKIVLLSPQEMATQNRVGMIAMRGAVTSLGYYENPTANSETYLDGWLLTGDAGSAAMFIDAPNVRMFVRDCRNLNLAELLLKYPFIEERYHSLLKKLKETGIRTALMQVLQKEAPILSRLPLYFIKGRIKDIIIAKGQNIPCDEIEAGALSYPGVFEAVAVGIPDVEDGEVPALVVTRHGQSQCTANDILAYCRDRKVLPRIGWPIAVAIAEALPKTPTGKYQRVRAREVYTAATQWTAPFKTPKFGIDVLDLAVAQEYNPERRPKQG